MISVENGLPELTIFGKQNIPGTPVCFVSRTFPVLMFYIREDNQKQTFWEPKTNVARTLPYITFNGFTYNRCAVRI